MLLQLKLLKSSKKAAENMPAVAEKYTVAEEESAITEKAAVAADKMPAESRESQQKMTKRRKRAYC